MSKLPLNGTKTHPLSAHARGVLSGLRRQDKRSYLINPGVVDRLIRGGLAEHYLDRDGKGWLRITDAGRQIMEAPDE